MWQSAINLTGLGESGYWGNWPCRCLPSEIQHAEQISQHSWGFHFIQRLWAALKEVLLPCKKKEKEVVTQWSSGSVQIFLCCYLTWPSFNSFSSIIIYLSIPSPPLKSRWSSDLYVSFILLPLQSKISTVRFLFVRIFIITHVIFNSLNRVSANRKSCAHSDLQNWMWIVEWGSKGNGLGLIQCPVLRFILLNELTMTLGLFIRTETCSISSCLAAGWMSASAF